jgi:hypothetical protein
MSGTQSQTPQSGALHDGAAPIGSANLAADLLQNFEQRERGEPDRPEFIEQNHGVRSAQSGRHNRRARDLLLIPCRFSKRKTMTRLLVEAAPVRPRCATRAMQIERTLL